MKKVRIFELKDGKFRKVLDIGGEVLSLLEGF